MPIAFAEVPREEQSPVPVRVEGEHLSSFAPPPGQEPDQEFTFFPRSKAGAEAPPEPDLAIPQAWPAIDKDKLRQIVDGMERL